MIWTYRDETTLTFLHSRVLEAKAKSIERSLLSTWFVFTDGACSQDDKTGSIGGVLVKKYVNIPSEKYIYVHKYVYICVYTDLCKMDEHRSYAGLSEKWMSTGLMLACHKNG